MKKRAAGRQHRESSGSTNKRVAEKLLAQDERYLHLADLESYLEAHMKAARLYQNRSEWAAKAILNVSRTGYFSSDRARSRVKLQTPPTVSAVIKIRWGRSS